MIIKKTDVFKITLLWSLLASANHMWAQDTTGITKKTTITLAAILCNNADYYGQVAEEKMPYAALSGTVRLAPGLYFSALAYKILTDSNAVSAAAISAGYDFKITGKWLGDVSYTYSFYPSFSPLLQASTPHSVSAGIVYEDFLKTGLTGDFTFGKEQDFFLTLSNSKNFDVATFNNKATLSLTPQLDLTAGTQHFYNTYIIEKEKKNTDKGKGKNKRGTQIIETAAQRFGMISYNFIVPVAYSRASYMIEAAAQLSLLDKKVAAGGGSVHSFFKLSAYYQL